MKRLAILSLLSLSSCAISEIDRHRETCVIEDVEIIERYGGLLPEKNYLIKTNCGYTLSTNRRCYVGDTISVEVHTLSKN